MCPTHHHPTGLWPLPCPKLVSAVVPVSPDEGIRSTRGIRVFMVRFQNWTADRGSLSSWHRRSVHQRWCDIDWTSCNHRIVYATTRHNRTSPPQMMWMEHGQTPKFFYRCRRSNTVPIAPQPLRYGSVLYPVYSDFSTTRSRLGYNGGLFSRTTQQMLPVAIAVVSKIAPPSFPSPGNKPRLWVSRSIKDVYSTSAANMGGVLGFTDIVVKTWTDDCGALLREWWGKRNGL